ncbi:MAG: type II toxin-antitoxin system Phd/YefM family antitoxin [Terriglobales bacterium]
MGLRGTVADVRNWKGSPAHHCQRELMIVSISYARTHISRLLRGVESGREVTITRRGVPVARLVPITKGPKRTGAVGADRGRQRGKSQKAAPQGGFR